MQLIDAINEKLGTNTLQLAGKLAKQGYNVKSQTLYYPRTKGMALGLLVALKRVSGLTWTQFGALLDQEFLTTKKEK